MRKMLYIAISAFVVLGVISSAYAVSSDAVVFEGDSGQVVVQDAPDMLSIDAIVAPEINIDEIYTLDAAGAWSAEFDPGDELTVNEAITIAGDPAQVYDMQVRYYFTDAAGNDFLLGKQLYRNYAPGTVYVSLTGAVPVNAVPGRGAVRNAALLAQGATLLDRGTLAGYINVGDGCGFTEDFNDGAADNWVDDGSGRWGVAGGEYVMTGTGAIWANTSYMETGNQDFADFSYQVDINKISGNELSSMGVIFRSDGAAPKAGNGYAFYITAYGDYSLWEYTEGAVTALIPWTNSPLINTGIGAVNTVKATACGANIELYVNGSYLNGVTNTAHAFGLVGLQVYDASMDVVLFDNASLVCACSMPYAGAKVKSGAVNAAVGDDSSSR